MKNRLILIGLPLFLIAGAIFANEEIHRTLSLQSSNQELGQILHQAEQALVSEGYRQRGALAIKTSGNSFRGEVTFRKAVPESAYFDAKIVVTGTVRTIDGKQEYDLAGLKFDRNFGTKE